MDELLTPRGSKAAAGGWNAFSRFQQHECSDAEELQPLGACAAGGPLLQQLHGADSSMMMLGGSSSNSAMRREDRQCSSQSGCAPPAAAAVPPGAAGGAGVDSGAYHEDEEADETDRLAPSSLETTTDMSGGGSGSSGGLSPWIILPEGQFKTGWLYIQLAVAMYIVWVTPLRVGFGIPAEGLWFWFEGMIDFFFYIDLGLNFCTAYEDAATGDLVTCHASIARRYLTGWFAVDLLATFPVDYIVRAVQGSWLCSLRGDCSWALLNSAAISPIVLLRLLRFFRILWILKHTKMMRFTTLLGGLADDLYAILPALSILELVIVLVYLGHISGCFFYLLSTPPWQTPGEHALIASGEMTTWMQRAFGADRIIMLPTQLPASGSNATLTALSTTSLNATLDAKGRRWVCPEFGYSMVACPGCEGPPMRCKSHYGLAYRYITAMYWAYTTMTTVGYGDISSTTLAEKVWAIITMIVSGFFFSFVVGRMAALVAKLDSHRAAYNERMEVVTTFLRDTDLPRPLSKRVLDMFRKQKVKPYDRQAVLGVLPFELKSKILRHLYAGAIRDVPLLRRIADDDLFMTDMCIRLQPYSCPADTFVYQRGEPGGDVFILMRGELVQLDVDLATRLGGVAEGSVFGEGTVLRQLEGFGRAKRTENMWCASPCYLMRIAQEDMHDLLDVYPQLLDTLRSLNSRRRGGGGKAAAGRGMRSSNGAAAASLVRQSSHHAVSDGTPVALRPAFPSSGAGSGHSSQTDLAAAGGGVSPTAAAPSGLQQQQQQQLPDGAPSSSSPSAAALKAEPQLRRRSSRQRPSDSSL